MNKHTPAFISIQWNVLAFIADNGFFMKMLSPDMSVRGDSMTSRFTALPRSSQGQWTRTTLWDQAQGVVLKVYCAGVTIK